MANSHVPKFGNWENEDVPYTAYFENARKDKPVGNVKINPNDPEENPEAFMMMMMMQRRGSSRSLEGNNSSHHNPDSSVLQTAAVQPPRRLMKSASTEKSRHADEHTRYREHHAHHRNGIADTDTNYSSTNTTTLGNNHKSPASESGSDQKTSSDNSLLDRPNQGRYVRSDDYKKKTSTTSSGRGSDSSSSASEQGHHRRQRSSSTNHSSDHQQHHHRAASIPKFGSWDVNDPKSGEGFTVIFDRIKEEKQNNGAIEVPTMLPPRPPTNHLKDRSKRSCVSKICCCMSSSGSE